jgi:hypothetical protein
MAAFFTMSDYHHSLTVAIIGASIYDMVSQMGRSLGHAPLSSRGQEG